MTNDQFKSLQKDAMIQAATKTMKANMSYEEYFAMKCEGIIGEKLTPAQFRTYLNDIEE